MSRQKGAELNVGSIHRRVLSSHATARDVAKRKRPKSDDLIPPSSSLVSSRKKQNSCSDQKYFSSAGPPVRQRRRESPPPTLRKSPTLPRRRHSPSRRPEGKETSREEKKRDEKADEIPRRPHRSRRDAGGSPGRPERKGEFVSQSRFSSGREPSSPRRSPHRRVRGSPSPGRRKETSPQGSSTVELPAPENYDSDNDAIYCDSLYQPKTYTPIEVRELGWSVKSMEPPLPYKGSHYLPETDVRRPSPWKHDAPPEVRDRSTAAISRELQEISKTIIKPESKRYYRFSPYVPEMSQKDSAVPTVPSQMPKEAQDEISPTPATPGLNPTGRGITVLGQSSFSGEDDNTDSSNYNNFDNCNNEARHSVYSQPPQVESFIGPILPQGLSAAPPEVPLSDHFQSALRPPSSTPEKNNLNHVTFSSSFTKSRDQTPKSCEGGQQVSACSTPSRYSTRVMTPKGTYNKVRGVLYNAHSDFKTTISAPPDNTPPVNTTDPDQWEAWLSATSADSGKSVKDNDSISHGIDGVSRDIDGVSRDIDGVSGRSSSPFRRSSLPTRLPSSISPDRLNDPSLEGFETQYLVSPRGAGPTSYIPTFSELNRRTPRKSNFTPSRHSLGSSTDRYRSRVANKEESPPVPRSVRVSKVLSAVCRHRKHGANLITMHEGGYFVVSDVLSLPVFKEQNVSESELLSLIRDNDKQRFSLKELQGKLLVCANQGHSVKVQNLELEEIRLDTIPAVVVHGTYEDAWKLILETGGLCRMARNHIHFATGLPRDGVISGMRSNCEILIYIDIVGAIGDGYKFYKSKNGVVLCEGNAKGLLPYQYFKSVKRTEDERELKYTIPKNPPSSGHPDIYGRSPKTSSFGRRGSPSTTSSAHRASPSTTSSTHRASPSTRPYRPPHLR